MQLIILYRLPVLRSAYRFNTLSEVELLDGEAEDGAVQDRCCERVVSVTVF